LYTDSRASRAPIGEIFLIGGYLAPPLQASERTETRDLRRWYAIAIMSPTGCSTIGEFTAEFEIHPDAPRGFHTDYRPRYLRGGSQ